jgi:XTP/dITP diphosphohydrolase
MKKNIVFITGNEGKRKEVEQILGIDKYNIVNIDLDVPEIQTISVEEVTDAKIKSAYELLKENFKEVIQKFNEKDVKIKNINEVIVICEDTGLYIEDMNNFPGALIKFYFASLNVDGIAKINGGSLAKAETVIGVIKYGKIQKSLIGNRTGKIAKKIVSKEAFGWDPIFIPDLTKTKYSEYDGKTYAELKKLEIKNEISHRKKAFDKFKKLLK